MRIRAVRFDTTVATLGWMTLLLLMLTLTIPAPSHAAIFFDTSFEACAVGTGNDFPCEGWDDFKQEAVGHLQITNSLAFSGTKSVKGTFDNVNGSSRKPSISRSWTRVPHIFARFAHRASLHVDNRWYCIETHERNEYPGRGRRRFPRPGSTASRWLTKTDVIWRRAGSTRTVERV